jgi:hypothetical protein
MHLFWFSLIACICTPSSDAEQLSIPTQGRGMSGHFCKHFSCYRANLPYKSISSLKRRPSLSMKVRRHECKAIRAVRIPMTIYSTFRCSRCLLISSKTIFAVNRMFGLFIVIGPLDSSQPRGGQSAGVQMLLISV